MPRASTGKQINAVQRALLRWYGRHRRDLPWRRRSDPYAIWVSEIMLQQTQVETVKPYFARFLKCFRTVRALAEAPLDDVLKAWEGLGYYARARNLHRAAKQIIAEHGSRLPSETSQLLALPGIGRYTAGAIASIAFGRDEPVLDGNVTRVLCRLFRIRTDPKSSATQSQLWALARDLIPAGQASLLNQALMDLGATICVLRVPQCLLCPVERLCLARQHGEESRLPVAAPRRRTPHCDVAAGVIWKGDRILIDQRKSEGLLGGLWEFPGGKRRSAESLKACLMREVKEELGIRIEVVRPFITVKHAYTHFRITLHCFECRFVSGRPRALRCAAWKWVRRKELDRYAFPAANHKVIEALRRR